MYNQHFGLERAPFKITPDTGLFFTGGGRGETLQALVYAIVSGEGIIKVVGEVGTGKTMLCRMLEVRLPNNVELVYLANPSLSAQDILHAIALEMSIEIPPGTNRVQVMHLIQRHLLDMHANSRHVVVLVEEAQSMPNETLEEIRLLSNLETKQDKLLQVVLFGQPELDDKLSDTGIRQLRDRITHSFYLDPLDSEDIREYVDFRLRSVGFRGRAAFQRGAYDVIARASSGLTRRVNILADKALLAAFAEDAHDVTRKHVQIAVTDSQFGRLRNWGWPELTVSFGVVTVGLAVAWALLGSGSPADAGPAVPDAASGEPVADVFVSDIRLQPAAPAPAPVPVVQALPEDRAPAPARRPGDDLVLARSLAAGRDEAVASPPEPAPAMEPAPARAAPAVESPPVVAAAAPLVVPAGAVQRGGSKALAEPAAPSPKTVAANAPSAIPVAVADVARPEKVLARGPLTPATAPAEVTRTIPAAHARQAESLVDQRLMATRAWLDGADRSHYSIQLLVTDSTRRRNLEDFLRSRAEAGEIDDVYVYQTTIDGTRWYGVLYREYASYSEARDALALLPAELSRHRPFIRNVRDVAALG